MIAIPKISVIIVTLQALGFLMVMHQPAWIAQLALFPDALLQGEYWRAITFLSLPISTSPIWVIFTLWFLYFILESVEAEWGAFPVTLYILISWLITLAYSIATGVPVLHARHFESSLFLAAAMLFPDFEVSLFFVLPVKLKWLGLATLLFVVVEAVQVSWVERGLLLAIFSNVVLFFGPGALRKFRSRRNPFGR